MRDGPLAEPEAPVTAMSRKVDGVWEIEAPIRMIDDATKLLQLRWKMAAKIQSVAHHGTRQSPHRHGGTLWPDSPKS